MTFLDSNFLMNYNCVHTILFNRQCLCEDENTVYLIFNKKYVKRKEIEQHLPVYK